MTSIINCYKKVFENKKAHIWIFLFALIWAFTSSLYDVKFSTIDTYKDNPIDMLLGFLVFIYGTQFVHNAIHNINNGVLPNIKKIHSEIAWGVFKLSIIWGTYAVISVLLAFIAYVFTHKLIIPIIIITLILILSISVQYIFITFAESFDTKNLWKLTYLFKIIKQTYKPLYINFCLFLLSTLVAMAVYVTIYILAGLTGIDKIGYITNDFYFIDVIMNTIATYFIIITWYFAFPYSLIPSYKEFIRPVLNIQNTDNLEKGNNNG